MSSDGQLNLTFFYLVCQVCHGEGFTEDSGGNKVICGACRK